MDTFFPWTAECLRFHEAGEVSAKHEFGMPTLQITVRSYDEFENTFRGVDVLRLLREPQTPEAVAGKSMSNADKKSSARRCG